MQNDGNNVDLEFVACPLGCVSGDRNVTSSVDRLHGRTGVFRVVRCEKCGLMRTNPRPTQAAISRYYPDDYHPYQTPGTQRPESHKLLRAIAARFIDNGKRIPRLPAGQLLEIGCANGVFLAQMSNAGWQVEGIEMSRSAVAQARSLGFTVYEARVESLTGKNNFFDLIVGWMVLEHLHHPIAALTKLYQTSKPGGYLVLSVPDAGSWEFRVFRDAWYALDLPRHLYHFDRASITKMLEQSGWQVKKIFWHSNPNNLILSLRYRCLERGWEKVAAYLKEIADGKRHRLMRIMLGSLLGVLHASGRMTVWAKRT